LVAAEQMVSAFSRDASDPSCLKDVLGVDVVKDTSAAPLLPEKDNGSSAT
jgi:hypothetical protein